MKKRVTPLTKTLQVLLLCGGVIFGIWVSLLAASGEVQRTSLGTIKTKITPSMRGSVTVYVPIVDWKLEILNHAAPATIAIELRGINRSSAGESISSRTAAQRSLAEIQDESHKVLSSTIKRGVIITLIGGVAGGFITGGLITAFVYQRRWLVFGIVSGFAVSGLILVGSVQTLKNVDADDVRADALTTNANELPKVLRFAEQLLVVGDEYEQHYETALKSAKNLVSFSRSSRGDHSRSVFVISDIHDNIFVLDAFRQFVNGRTVFAVGDYGQVGAKVEQRTAPLIASLGEQVIAVSGNHDSASYMRSLERAGATVLPNDQARDGLLRVDDLLVAGYPDPLERQNGARGNHVLRVYGNAYEQQVTDFLEWWKELPERPDVLMVHQHGFAHRLVNYLRENDPEDAPPLAIFTGHDHKPHVHQYQKGRLVIIDGGTLGAGGPFAIGSQKSSFAQVNLSDQRVVSVDLVAVEPLGGNTSTERIHIG